MRFRTLAAAGLAVSVTSVLALAAGNWSTLPIVGSASFCGSTVTLSTGQGCGQTIPAGPPTLTGSELIPADTGLAGGASPQSVTIPSSIFATGAIQVVTTNASVTIANGISALVSNQGTATIAAITLPSAPMNNQLVRIANAGSGVLTITAINANTGQSIVQGAAAATLAVQTNNSAAAASSDTAYMYQASNTTWYRIK